MASPVCVRSSYSHRQFTTPADRTQGLIPATPLFALSGLVRGASGLVR